ncbi:MAG: hypothetical protein KY460_14640 [Actinobacteria bacterium]|nr:hypothetical protein [Actinomycetota bacterium]
MELMIEIAGWVAAGVLLGAYALLSRGKLSGQGPSFQSLNVVGSLLVGLNSVVHQAWPSASVNLVWLVIGVATLAASRHTAASRDDDAATSQDDAARATDSDAGAYASALPSDGVPDARAGHNAENSSRSVASVVDHRDAPDAGGAAPNHDAYRRTAHCALA